MVNEFQEKLLYFKRNCCISKISLSERPPMIKEVVQQVRGSFTHFHINVLLNVTENLTYHSQQYGQFYVNVQNPNLTNFNSFNLGLNLIISRLPERWIGSELYRTIEMASKIFNIHPLWLLWRGYIKDKVLSHLRSTIGLAMPSQQLIDTLLTKFGKGLV